MKRFFIILGAVIGGLTAFILLLFIAVLLLGGPITRQIVEKHSTEWVGRQITLDNPTINLFNGSVKLRNVEMLEQDGQSTFARFDTLYTQINIFALVKKEVCIKHIWMTGLNSKIAYRNGYFNFQDIIDHFASDDNEQNDTSKLEWGIGLYDIRLHDGAISYTDLERRSRWGVENININIPGICFGKDQTEAGVTLDFPNNCGSLRLEANLDQESGAFNVDLDLDTIRLDMAMPFVHEYANISRIGSRLTGCFQARGTIHNITNARISGNVKVEDTDIRDTDSNSIFKLKRANVEVDSINLAKNRIVLKQLEVNGLYTTFERWTDHCTIDNILINRETKPEVAELTVTQSDSNAVESVLPLQLLIRKVNISNINATYVDHALQSPFSYSISKLAIKARNFSLKGQNNITLTAELPQGGSIFANFIGSTDLHHGNEKLILTVKNMLLAPFSPWCEEFTATPITGGTLSITSENRINNGVLRGINNIDIYGMTAGEKIIPSQAPYKSIPVKLGISLLEDIDHKINISVPISGDINNPQFSYSKIIWKTIGNLLLKAAASPWIAIGNAMGINGEDLSSMPFDPIQPDFSSVQYAHIDKLVEVLNTEDELTFVMDQQFNLAEAIEARKTFDKKRAFYESKHGKIDQLSLVDMEDIRNIKDGNLAFKRFCAKNPMEFSDQTIQEEVLQLAEMRNKVLFTYITQQQKIAPERISIRMPGAATLMKYTGKAQYVISTGADSNSEEQ